MTPFRLRQLILLLTAVAVGTGSLLAPETALADEQLFRVQQAWHNFPNPAVTSPGNAGRYIGWIQPYPTVWPNGNYKYPPGTANVTPLNLVGAPFTLPTKAFLTIQGTYTINPQTGWPGYTTYSYIDYYNGPVKMEPNNGSVAPVRLVFPTIYGNPYPNWATGPPNLPTRGDGKCKDGADPHSKAPPGGGCGTTTFNGLYDFDRYGEIRVQPGVNRFGGTYHMFHGPQNSTFRQYVFKFTPTVYDAYGAYTCFDEGKFGCTKDNFVSDIGDTTIYYTFTRYLRNPDPNTGTGHRQFSKTAKATTPIGLGRGFPTSNGQGTPTSSNGASYIVAVQRYLNLIHPWTTGNVVASNPKGSPHIITPQYKGYDIDLFGETKLKITRVNPDSVWNKTNQTLEIVTDTFTDYLYGVGRVVSLVRPRLTQTYTTPIDPGEPIWNSWPVVRLKRLKVWFLPEPTGMLLLGTGMAALLGLARIRRR
jgi:hypothetical protein